MIVHALEGKPLPIYGDGSNVCDWLRVSDHCDALMSVIDRGRIGERNNVGGGNERSNGDVVGPIRDGLDRAFAADRGLA
jgi:dTDP-glucose 4,6-dehydratase